MGDWIVSTKHVLRPRPNQTAARPWQHKASSSALPPGKYSGWRGQLYDESRYVWRGRFAEARSRSFAWPNTPRCSKPFAWMRLLQIPQRPVPRTPGFAGPADFQFALKVTDEITVNRFPNLPRFGRRAGNPNEHFLNPALFASAFLGPCEPFRANIGLLIFEFSRFSRADYEHGRDFAAALDEFPGTARQRLAVRVEIRNRNFLHPDYFAMLARHGTATFSIAGRICRRCTNNCPCPAA